MKPLLFTLAISVCMMGHSLAQEEPQTLFGAAEKQEITSFYWGPEVRLHFYGTRMREAASPLLGGKLGLIINRKVIIGLGGWGKISRTTFSGHYTDTDDGKVIDNPNQKMAVGYGYGGLIAGIVFRSNEAVHITFTSLFGRGTSNEYIIQENGSHGTTFNSPGFGIVEPTLNAELNLTRHFRLEAGLGYRWIAANRFEQLTTRDLSGFTLQAAVKIGGY
jgi:hypothetical protein